MSEPSGIILINKPQGATSHRAVAAVRHLLQADKAGHTGTLDPDATGVLVVMVGRGVKAAEYMTLDTKAYRAVMKLGVVTDTMDMTGSVLETSDKRVTEAEVLEACLSFTGDIKQVPPMYSALKVNGRKLVDLARRGIEVERAERDVHISRLDAVRLSEDEYVLDVECSSGTYIRTLCHDIGKRLGTGAAMQSLCRTRCGAYRIEDSHSIEELEAMSEDERQSLVIPTESVFSELAIVKLPQFYERLARSGCEIYLHKIKAELDTGCRVRLYGENGFFALGEVREYEEGRAVKAVKLFRLD